MRKLNNGNKRPKRKTKLNVSPVHGKPIRLDDGWDIEDDDDADFDLSPSPAIKRLVSPSGKRAGGQVGPRGRYNPKTHDVGRYAKRRTTRSRKRSSQVIYAPAPYLEAAAGPEPKDKEIDSLWACKSVREVVDLSKKWNRKFRRKCLGAIKRRKLEPEMRVMIANLLGSKATTTSIMTNPKVGRVAFKGLHRRLVALVAATPDIEVALVTFISGDGATSHVRPFIELHHSQKAMDSTLRAMVGKGDKQNFLGVTELALFNSHSHPDGGQVIQVHGHALIWGVGILGKAQKVAATHKAKFAANITDAPQIDVRCVRTDTVNLARVCAYLFKPPHRAMTWCPPREGKKGHMHQSEKGDRFTRYLRMAHIRSLLTFEDICFGGGDGQKIKGDIIKVLRPTCVDDAGGPLRSIHPDAIDAFWGGVTKALGKTAWTSPVIGRQK